MNKTNFYKNLTTSIKESLVLKKTLIDMQSDIVKSILKISHSIKKGKRIFICGNGGSNADAQHLAAEFIVRLNKDVKRKAIPAISLSLDSSTLTACGNDIGFQDIFSRPLEALANKGDILLCISTSGKSLNIINVLKLAKKKKIYTINFLGNTGGKAKIFGDINLIVKSNNVPRIQECHIFLGHFIFSEVERVLFKK
jgi:D-sedoheptulose 7-phosphate isomerase